MTLRRLKQSEVTSGIAAFAKSMLAAHHDKPFGFERDYVENGKTFVGRIEEHYHEPGGPVKPWGKHKGVSVFEKVADYGVVLDGKQYAIIGEVPAVDRGFGPIAEPFSCWVPAELWSSAEHRYDVSQTPIRGTRLSRWCLSVEGGGIELRPGDRVVVLREKA